MSPAEVQRAAEAHTLAAAIIAAPPGDVYELPEHALDHLNVEAMRRRARIMNRSTRK